MDTPNPGCANCGHSWQAHSWRFGASCDLCHCAKYLDPNAGSPVLLLIGLGLVAIALYLLMRASVWLTRWLLESFHVYL